MSNRNNRGRQDRFQQDRQGQEQADMQANEDQQAQDTASADQDVAGASNDAPAGQGTTGVQLQDQGASEATETVKAQDAPSSIPTIQQLVENVEEAVEEPIIVEHGRQPTPVKAGEARERHAPELQFARERLSANQYGLYADLPSWVQGEINGILLYVEKMAPGKYQEPAAGAQEQARLYQIFCNLFNRTSGKERDNVISLVLSIFHKYRDGALSEVHINRFVRHMTISEQDIRMFLSVSGFLMLFASPNKRREKTKHYDVARALSHRANQVPRLTEGARQALIQYVSQ